MPGFPDCHAGVSSESVAVSLQLPLIYFYKIFQEGDFIQLIHSFEVYLISDLDVHFELIFFASISSKKQ